MRGFGKDARFGRRYLITALVIAALGTGACNFSFSVGDKNLDTEALEAELKTQITAQTGVTIATATCPQDVPIEQGGTFTCTVATEDGTETDVAVTQDDDEGNVSWVLQP